MSDQTAYPCPQCQIGHLHSGQSTYVGVHQGMVISVPAMPTLTCDVCGYQEYEGEALLHLEALIGQATTPQPARRPSARSQSADATSARSLKP